MENEEDYSQILDGLLVGTDMDDEVSRKMAYNACLAYAEQKLTGDFAANAFMALAAERLGQVRVHFGIVKGIIPLPDDARLHLRYASQGGPVLTGNRDGLRYLSDLCAALADSPLPDGSGPEEHVHLYDGEPPMFGSSYAMTLYHSADEWFDRYGIVPEGEAETDPESAADAAPPREIAPEQVAALEFLEEDDTVIPPMLYLRYGKMYRVLKCRPYLPDEEIPSKPTASGSESRMHVFTFRDDAQEIFEIGLDLDDTGIHYFTRSDLEQVWGADTSQTAHMGRTA
jgi:hypothetical protein